jgi:hypothetical protein
MPPPEGPQPSAPEVKLKPKPHKKRRMRSELNDGEEPALPSSDSEENGEEGFQEVFNRRSKAQPKKDREHAAHQAGTIPKPLFHSVYIEAADQRKLNDFTVARALRQAKIDFAKVVSKGRSQVLVHYNTRTEAELLLNNKAFLQTVNCTAKLSQSAPENIKGILRGIDTDITEEEMKEELGKSKHFTVVTLKRLTRTDQNKEIIPTTTVLIEFKGNTLPRSVCMFSVSRTVQIYVTKPTICFNCHIYGHIASQCNSTTPTCGFCAERHNTRDCNKKKETDTPTCVNCKGTHIARSTECPVMRRLFETRMVSSLRTTTFQQAPRVNSTLEFPNLATNQATEGQSQQENQVEQPPEPRPLPPRAQKKAAQKFSHALQNRYANDQQKFESRQNRYHNLVQLAEEKTHRSSITPRHRENLARRESQPQYEPQRRTYRREPPQSQTEMNFDNILNYLITNQSALTSLLTILQVIVTTSVPQGDNLDPHNVKLIQQKLLKLRPPRRNSQRGKAQQSESEEYTEADENMDDE